MRPIGPRLTLALTLAAAPAFAAGVKAKPAHHKVRAASAKRHGYCPPHQKLTNMYFGGTRLCVDPRPIPYHLDNDLNVVYD